MRKIYLVRHGRPVFNGPRIALGQSMDYPVNEEYLKKAVLLKDVFKDKNIEKYYSSPMLRARQTLEAFIPQDKEMIILEGMKEASYGDWEGIEISKLTPDYGQGYIDSCRGVYYEGVPDIGHPEHVKDVSDRAIKAILSTEGNCVIAAHTTIISLTCSALYGLDWRDYKQYKVPYLSVTELTEDKGILSVSDFAHDYLNLELS